MARHKNKATIKTKVKLTQTMASKDNAENTKDQLSNATEPSSTKKTENIKKKLTKEEILERKRLAEHKRLEKIRSDAKRYEEFKDKQRKSYHKRKAEKKILPVAEMPAKVQKAIRKRNRDNFKAYYRRKKQQKLLEETQNAVLEYPPDSFDDEDSNSSVKFSSEIWGQFEQEDSLSRCVTCRQMTENTIDAMKNHLEEEHPGILISILNNRSCVDGVLDEEMIQDEEIFTEVTYLDEEDDREIPSKRARSTIRDSQDTPRIEYNIIRTETERPVIDTFLNYVGVLMKNVPKEALPKLQLDVISLILNAQMSESKTTTSCETTSSGNYKINIQNDDVSNSYETTDAKASNMKPF